MKTTDKNTLIAIISTCIATYGIWWATNVYWDLDIPWWVYLGFFLIFGGSAYSELNKNSVLIKQMEKLDD